MGTHSKKQGLMIVKLLGRDRMYISSAWLFFTINRWRCKFICYLSSVVVKQALPHMSEMSGKENNLQLCQLGMQRALIIRDIVSHHICLPAKKCG